MSHTIWASEASPYMGDTSGIFHIIYYYRTYVGVCVTPFFFFFGVRCAQYKVHAQCSFAALAPHMPCMLLVYMYVRMYIYNTYTVGVKKKVSVLFYQYSVATE